MRKESAGKKGYPSKAAGKSGQTLRRLRLLDSENNGKGDFVCLAIQRGRFPQPQTQRAESQHGRGRCAALATRLRRGRHRSLVSRSGVEKATRQEMPRQRQTPLPSRKIRWADP